MEAEDGPAFAEEGEWVEDYAGEWGEEMRVG
jgi:hypothetical protein